MPVGSWVTPLPEDVPLGNQQDQLLNGDDGVFLYQWETPVGNFAAGAARTSPEFTYARAFDGSGSYFTGAGAHGPTHNQFGQSLDWVNFDQVAYDALANWSPPFDDFATGYETELGTGSIDLFVRYTVHADVFFTAELPPGHDVRIRTVPPDMLEWDDINYTLRWAAADVPPGFDVPPATPWPLINTISFDEVGGDPTYDYPFQLDQLVGGVALPVAAHSDWLETGETPPGGDLDPSLLIAVFTSAYLLELWGAFQPPTYRLVYDAPWPLHQRQLGVPGLQQRQRQWW